MFLEYVKQNIVYVHLWSTFIYMQYNSLPHNSFGFKNSADVATEVISKVAPWHYEYRNRYLHKYQLVINENTDESVETVKKIREINSLLVFLSKN